MVIKNGVLMPKQKQRRYRTEKPFGCEICNARFTLRSNMERHVKHQHPKRWSQRPRGVHSTRGRPPSNPPTLLKTLNPIYQNNSINYSQRETQSTSSETNDKHIISTEVKNAILAQQSKVSKQEDNDSEDEELIIDEAAEEKDLDNQEAPERPATSLLRGKLEEHNQMIDNKNNNSMCGNVPKSDETSQQVKIKTEPEISEEDDKTDYDKEKPMLAIVKTEDSNADLASVSELLDNASQQYQQFRSQYISDEEGLVASTSDCNNSGSDEKSDSMNFGNSGDSNNSYRVMKKKKMSKKKKKKLSAYSMAPNKVRCTYCDRTFPWQSSLRRHILTHTGQKPFQCDYCSLLFTTKSNCDRHLLRKHRASMSRFRKKHSSSPEEQQPNNNNKFAMRNVPERPYKCNLCPSSTFSTLGNLKKHLSTKHSENEKFSRPETPTSETNSEPQPSPTHSIKQNDNSDESQSSSVSETNDNTPIVATDLSTASVNPLPAAIDATKSRKISPRASPGPADGPFKCHLCEFGFAERQDCLDHIKDNHVKAYELLLMKGALDMETENMDEHLPAQQVSDPEEKRGRFPDYSNRKVVCAFCMRRFWSAEDLRRHMRTHTGERPYICDICNRRFTLKHSMLRHRKKHESIESTMYVGESGDEENTPNQPPTITPRSQQQAAAAAFHSAMTGDAKIQERMSLPMAAKVATGDAAPNGLIGFNPYESLATFTGRLTNAQNNYTPDSTPDGDNNDLISNLLGIRDRSIIEQVLQASADDAARLLGVNGSHD